MKSAHEGQEKKCQMWASSLHEKVSDSDNVEQDVCIAVDLFCATNYINDERYLTGDEAPEGEWVPVRQARKISLEFYQTRSPDGPVGPQSHTIPWPHERCETELLGRTCSVIR